MDSVRFSIIENNIKWKETHYNADHPEEDSKSISSEGSAEGIAVDAQHSRLVHEPERFDQEIWEKNDIEKCLKDLPSVDTIIRDLKNGTLENNNSHRDINNALLTAVWHQKHATVVSLLNDFHGNPNTTDPKGRTPLHLACAKGDQVVTKILLRHGAKSHQWDDNLKATPLHCAASAGNTECIQLLLRNGAQLNAGIERRSPLHYAVERNHVKCVQTLLQYGANPNTPQVYTETPLHVAAYLGFEQCIRLLLDHGADVRSQFGKRRATALHLAVEEDYTDCARLLLDAGAMIDVRNCYDQTPLHIACLIQSPETLTLLIKRGADVHAVYKDGRTALHAAIVKDSKTWDCAQMLLKAGVDVNRSDNYGYTPLHLAALNEYSSCVKMLIGENERGGAALFINHLKHVCLPQERIPNDHPHCADVTARTNGGVAALSFIVRRTPEVIPSYMAKLDNSIMANDHEIGDVDCEIKLDFRELVPNPDRGETELLLTFIEVGQKRVLKHPLCETFLFLKWRRIRKFFLFSLFFHTAFVLLFTTYILDMHVYRCEAPCRISTLTSSLGYICLVFDVAMLLKELFQMAHGAAAYFRYWENWLQLAIIMGVLVCVLPQALMNEKVRSTKDWQQHAAAVVIFLVWLELMMLVGRFPIFGLYVQMFTKVAANFAKFLMAYICLIVAFSLSFCVLFPNYKPFNVQFSLLKTIVMMSGELEFENIFYGEEDTKYPTAHIMFMMFVLLITIILTNLMAGLAVNDIRGLQASAGLDRLSRQAELVSRLESLFFSKVLRRLPKRILHICQRSALLRTSPWHLNYSVKPNDPREKRLPKDLILSVYTMVAERKDRNQNLRHERKMANYDNFKRTMNDSNREKDIQLRNQRSSNYSNLRNRAVSDTQNNIHLRNIYNINRSSLANTRPDSFVERNVAKELVNKMEKMQEMLNSQYEEMKRELHLIRLRLES